MTKKEYQRLKLLWQLKRLEKLHASRIPGKRAAKRGYNVAIGATLAKNPAPAYRALVKV